jgi:membrane protease YdiL (CAAX protease family)
LKQLFKFIRSVLPADAMQLIFLGGLLCLIVAPHLRWLPDLSSHSLPGEFPFESAAEREARVEWGQFFVLAALPIIFAYAAGIFVCFWPGRPPIRRVLLSVLLPAIGGVAWICEHLVSRDLPRSSVFLSNVARSREIFNVARTTLGTLGPGFRVCLLGIILILIFTSRLAFRISSLPISIPNEDNFIEEDGIWRRTRLLTWFSVAPGFALVGAVLGILTIIAQSVLSRATGREIFVWRYGGADVVLAFALIGVVIWIAGPAGRHATVRALRWCSPLYLILAAVFAFGIDFAVSAGQYLYDYTYWGAHFYGRFPPPHLDAYFNAPEHSFQFLLGIVVGVFAEEITFRAILQPWLVKRYGIWRGLFFVGIIWSAAHFYKDFNFQMTELDALRAVGQRLLVCTALAFVFGWLTLRAKSIWPAVISHSSFNVMAFSESVDRFIGRATVRAVLWLVLAYFLFRYWPVQTDEPPRELLLPAVESCES